MIAVRPTGLLSPRSDDRVSELSAAAYASDAAATSTRRVVPWSAGHTTSQPAVAPALRRRAKRGSIAGIPAVGHLVERGADDDSDGRCTWGDRDIERVSARHGAGQRRANPCGRPESEQGSPRAQTVVVVHDCPPSEWGVRGCEHDAEWHEELLSTPSPLPRRGHPTCRGIGLHHGRFGAHPDGRRIGGTDVRTRPDRSARSMRQRTAISAESNGRSPSR